MSEPLASTDSRADTVIVLDFETTGLSPDMGDRAIEIGAVRIEHGQITARFQQLMNPGCQINYFIEEYTGISNEMLANAPSCEEVMAEFADFIEGYNLVAHNASFDKRFLDAELAHVSRTYSGQFACSMLASRRLFPSAPNHQLGTLVQYANIPSDGAFHRALYDSEMAAKVWLIMLEELGERYNIFDMPFSLIQKLSKVSKKSVHRFLQTS